MRLAIDDFPSLSSSRLRALGEIRPDAMTAVIQFPDGEVFTVPLQHVRFPNGGGWSFFVCACGRRCRTLRLYNNALACKHCLEARGFRYRVEDMSPSERAAHVASRLAARLASPSPARLKPHLWGRMERRSRLVAALRQCEFRMARRGCPRKTETIPDPCDEPDFEAPKRPWPGSKPKLFEPVDRG
jgi:hypothetical protein